MVTATSWMYVVDWGPVDFVNAVQIVCLRYRQRYDRLWYRKQSQIKRLVCGYRQNHDSRYVHWIRQIIHSRRRACHPSRRISHCSKTKFEKGNDQLLKTTSNLFFAPLNGFVYLSHTFSTIYQQPDDSSLLIKFYFIWTNRDLNTTQK